jgi:hypothetical protein
MTMTKAQAITEAKNTVAEMLKKPRDQWPEDDWIGIDTVWDLNAYIDDETGQRRAVLYPVHKGQTDTASFTRIYPAE